MLAQALVVVAALALLVWLWMDVKLRVLYPMFAPMVWIAFRWGVAATAFYTLVSEIGLLMALRGEAPTLAGPQLLLLTLAATGLLLASVGGRAPRQARCACASGTRHWRGRCGSRPWVSSPPRSRMS